MIPIEKPFSYTVVRSHRKTLGLEIKRDASVVVRAPQRCPQSVIDHFVERNTQWIERHLAAAQERLQRRPEPSPEEEAALRERARRELPPKLAAYAERMGLQPAGVRITSARTRFGSCSADNHICFSWRLMQCPEAAIDYVVVHELAHIREKNHGRTFYALIEQYLPDWRERRALLKE